MSSVSSHDHWIETTGGLSPPGFHQHHLWFAFLVFLSNWLMERTKTGAPQVTLSCGKHICASNTGGCQCHKVRLPGMMVHSESWKKCCRSTLRFKRWKLSSLNLTQSGSAPSQGDKRKNIVVFFLCCPAVGTGGNTLGQSLFPPAVQRMLVQQSQARFCRCRASEDEESYRTAWRSAAKAP